VNGASPPTAVFSLRKQRRPTMYFIGVTTAGSSIMRIFPNWMQELGRPDVRIVGIDLRLHDDPAHYRAAVAGIKCDPLALGALVTTHKIDLLNAAADLFDYLDPYAVACGEVSSISKNAAAIEGHAKDPIAAGLTLDAILKRNYFTGTEEILCLGAGGSVTAILLHFIEKRDSRDRPRRILVVDRLGERLERLKRIVSGPRPEMCFTFHHHQQPHQNDALLADLPPRSIVINGTGMGKDRPGSPITGAGLFPEDGIAWELNYRGELDFLHQARAQAGSRRLRVENGWLYFLHGWMQVISQVLKVQIDGRCFARLAEIARQQSPPPPWRNETSTENRQSKGGESPS